MIRTQNIQDLYDYEYVVYDEYGKRVKILCRKCGETIADVIETGKMRNSKTGRMEMRHSFRSLSNYTKVQLELSSNAEMQCAMCKKCAKHLSQPELDALYLSEIQAIDYDGLIHDKDVSPLVDGLLQLKVYRRVG